MVVPMISQLIGAIAHQYHPRSIFIFGYFGVPKMGVAGAAVATVIGQILAMIFVLIVLKVGTHEVDIAPWRHHPQMQAAKDIYRVGIPTFVMNAIGSVDNRDERDSDGLFRDRRSGAGHLFQTSVVCLHADFRPEPGRNADPGL